LDPAERVEGATVSSRPTAPAGRHRFALVGLLVVAIAALSGCGDEVKESTGSSSTSIVDATTTTTAADATETTAGGGDPGTDKPYGEEPSGAPMGGATTTTVGAPSAGGPVFDSFSVTADPCPSNTVAPDASITVPPFDGKVSVSWQVRGSYDTLYNAVDNPDGAYTSGLPASGTAEFTRQCGSAHTYYVVAVSGGKKTVKSQTVPVG
jgi:hypothetical protein